MPAPPPRYGRCARRIYPRESRAGHWPPAPRARREGRERRSHLHDLLLLLLHNLVDLRNAPVRFLLDAGFGAFGLVLRHFLVLEEGLQPLVGVAPLVADCHAVVLSLGADLLCNVLAPLLGERRDGQADELPIVHRGETEVGLAQRLLNLLDEALLPRLDGN